MRIPHYFIIGVAALVAMFAIGCSKSSPMPVVSFQGYHVDKRGMTYASFKATNPSDSPIVCQVQIGSSDTSRVTEIPVSEGGYSVFPIFVQQTNATSFSVKVMRLVPVHQFTVPIK